MQMPPVLVLTHRVFHACFFEPFAVELQGGYAEPVYFPSIDSKPAIIGYRQDYVRSALHEIAHWCVAGEQRRKLEDYGYWYEPDGRTAVQQTEFFRAEVKPQALEYAFCLALEISFEVSCDNLGSLDFDAQAEFHSQVLLQLSKMLREGFLSRAEIFLHGLTQTNNLHWLEEKIKGLV